MMKLPIVARTFLLLVFQYSETKVQAVSCKWSPSSSPCACEYKDPNTTKMMTVDISHYFEYPYTPKPDKTNYIYTFNPCKEIQCVNTHSKGVACQYIKSQNVSNSLGILEDSNSWFINEPSAGKFQFTITYKGGDPVKSGNKRQAKVLFTYENADMKMEVTSEQETTYNMAVSGRLVQPHAHSSGGGGGGKKSGGTAPGIIGIVIIILALGGVVAYFVAGVAYMYKVKGARGTEMIPNYTFWKEIPFLIKDGFFFTISPCYKREQYEKL